MLAAGLEQAVLDAFEAECAQPLEGRALDLAIARGYDQQLAFQPLQHLCGGVRGDDLACVVEGEACKRQLE